MKRSRFFAALLGALLLLAPLFPAALAASALSGFSVEWAGEAPALTAVAAWTYEGEQYEMAVTGLKSRLAESVFRSLAKDFHENRDAALTDTALTDAEKFSHLVPHRAGDEDTWVVTDEVRGETMWGDSLLCWTASTGNMIASSG